MIDEVEERINRCFASNPETRDDYVRLVLRYWREELLDQNRPSNDDLVYHLNMILFNIGREKKVFTSPETITRKSRDIQNRQGKFVPTQEAKRKRQERQKELTSQYGKLV